MAVIEYWHNPRCSKSRAGLAFFEEAGIKITVRKYLDDVPTLAELHKAHRALGGVPVIAMMRKGEARFKELGLSAEMSDDVLFNAMAHNPILIERPLAIRDGRALIGRPTEAFSALL